MPRPSNGARLYLRKRKGRPGVWVIKDGQHEVSTGTSSREEADQALAAYIQSRTRPTGPIAAYELTCGYALTIYAEEHAPTVAAPQRIGYAIQALDAFWGDLTVSEIKGPTCRRYAAARGVSDSTIRRGLGVPQAAVNHCAREGYLLTAPTVWRPDPVKPKERWLTREEVARMLRACRKLRIDGQHLSKFILAGVYTGRRKAALLSMRIDTPATDGGYVDTRSGILHGTSAGERITSKRRPDARLPRPFLAHIRRWKASGCQMVVEDYQGRRLGDIRKAWSHMVEISEVGPEVTRTHCATPVRRGLCKRARIPGTSQATWARPMKR